jgi:hypothetical protein
MNQQTLQTCLYPQNKMDMIAQASTLDVTGPVVEPSSIHARKLVRPGTSRLPRVRLPLFDPGGPGTFLGHFRPISAIFYQFSYF